MRRRALLGLAGLIPIVPIVIGVLLGASAPGTAHTTGPYTPVGSQAAPPPRAQHTHRVSGIPGGKGALIAILRHPTTLRSAPAPNGRVIHALGMRTEFGSPEVLWVVTHRPGWLGVLSPLVGNGKTGWIPESAATLARTTWELEVSLSERRLTVISAGAVLKRYTVAIGAPYAPTPTGRFSLTDRLVTNDPSGPYGCCILALSAHSPHAIQGWSGGDRIAIHSTPDSGSVGQAVSHGCLRVTIAEGRWLMNHVPLGTPTLISS